MFDRLIQKLSNKLLFFFWFFVTSPPVLLITWFFSKHEDLRANLGWLGFLFILAWFFGSWWLAMTTSHYMFNEKKMFLEAVKHTLRDLRLKLAFIPILDAWFKPDEDKTRNGDDD